MAEIRRGRDPGDKSPDRLPWLEPVEDEDYAYAERASYGGVIAAAIAVLLGIAALTGAAIWWRSRGAETAASGQIIRAPAGPYKQRPRDAGGMKPDAAGEVAYGTNAGQDIDSPIDLAALPEQPVSGPGAPPSAEAPVPPRPAPAADQPHVAAKTPLAPSPTPAPAPAPIKPAPPAVAPAATARVAAAPPSAGGGGTIQLGAFSSQAKAAAAWKSLSRRFAFLADMTQSVAPVQSGETTLYRLRASGGGDAASLCARLRVAGESCAVVG